MDLVRNRKKNESREKKLYTDIRLAGIEALLMDAGGFQVRSLIKWLLERYSFFVSHQTEII